MTNIVIRQNDLFLGEEWSAIYKTFTNVNFKAYSFDTIKAAMIEYIRVNYPEDFNDWTENSEFIMLIDLLAYMGESLAYRVDMNARDNFLDTAERRESILRLAKMISYTPSRNKPAEGKLKIRSVKTTQLITDHEGRNLQNKVILWNDPQNPDWFEQFIIVMNASFNKNNPFGKPNKNVTVDGTNIQTYKMGTIPRTPVTKEFNAIVAGENMTFEIINADVNENGSFEEYHPDPNSSKTMIYMNDGSGNGSINTGFFLYFKQGKLEFQNYNFSSAIENRSTTINYSNINDSDVWVSEINENGDLVEEWIKIPSIENIVYNSIDKETRKIFSVQTLDDDKINVRFSDGRFGTVPKGLFRIWTRVSNGLEYTINPQEIRAKTVTYKYSSNTGTNQDSQYEVTFTFDLFDTIRNSAATETDKQIKERAPRVYYSQNRMANGEDYNSYPLSYGPEIVKLKAVNRVYAGQSPYFNNYDPTKKYSSTVEFGDDGILYKQDYKISNIEHFPTHKSTSEIAASQIVPLLYNDDLSLFFMDSHKPVAINVSPNPSVVQSGWYWVKISGQDTMSTGYISTTNGGPSLSLLPTDPEPRNLFTESAYVLFEEPFAVAEDITKPKRKWAFIQSVTDGGIHTTGNTVGPITIDENISSGWKVMYVIPAFRQVFTATELELVVAQLENNNTFGLRYDLDTQSWKIIDELNVSTVDSEYSEEFAGDNTDANRDASWLIHAQYSAQEYVFTSRNIKYIFESVEKSRFFFHEDEAGINRTTSSVNKSKITVLGLNEDLKTEKLLKQDYDFTITDNIRYSDGYIEPRRVSVIPANNDSDNSFDYPTSFDIITNLDVEELYVFHQQTTDGYGFTVYEPTTLIYQRDTLSQLELYDWENNISGYIAGFAKNTETFYVWNEDEATLEVADEDAFRFHYGRTGLNYKYEHFTSENSRIDPAITNIIDMYVLTGSYYDNVKEWKAGNRSTPLPKPEESSIIQKTFAGLDNFKMISDQMIWNNSQFTLLFGPEANIENQAIIKIVKIKDSTLTDNQIKQGVLDAIEEYFNLDNWSFGDSIFTSELVAYIHKKMITHVASCVIVPKQRNASGDRRPDEFFQIRQEFNALPLNVCTISDIVIVPTASKENIVG